MSLSLYDAFTPELLGGLGVLRNMLVKGQTHVEVHKLDADALLTARLYPDMFTFEKNVQAATDLARRAMDRLADQEASNAERPESSFQALLDRVSHTRELVMAHSEENISSAESRQFTVNVGTDLDFTGRKYVQAFALPNFFFHITTAYNILRHNGVELGKRDFIEPFMLLFEQNSTIN